MSNQPQSEHTKRNAPSRVERIERALHTGFGQQATGTFECRFRRTDLTREEARTVLSTFGAKGWTVSLRPDGTDVVFEFSNPPSGVLQLSPEQSRAVQTLVTRVQRFIAGGLTDGSKSYPLVETVPFRVLAVAAELLRLNGLAVTIAYGQQNRPKALVISGVLLDRETLPKREGSEGFPPK